MSDLISRSALLKCFSITKDGHRIPEKDCDNFEVTVSIKDIKRIIKYQPTAYDVDAVVAELEEHKTQYGKLQLSHNDANMVCVYVGKEQAIDCAIETVKAGGKV